MTSLQLRIVNLQGSESNSASACFGNFSEHIRRVRLVLHVATSLRPNPAPSPTEQTKNSDRYQKQKRQPCVPPNDSERAFGSACLFGFLSGRADRPILIPCAVNIAVCVSARAATIRFFLRRPGTIRLLARAATVRFFLRRPARFLCFFQKREGRGGFIDVRAIEVWIRRKK